jgi:type IV pilus assembly protein PilM
LTRPAASGLLKPSPGAADAGDAVPGPCVTGAAPPAAAAAGEIQGAQVRRTVVGLDIGHTSIRAVGISAGPTPTVTAIGAAPVVPGAVNEGEVLDPSSVSASLKQAWEKSGLGPDVILGVSGRHVIVRQLELPWLEEKAFRQALPYRVSGQLPVPVEDVVLDYVVLGEGKPADAAGGRMLSLLLVAAMRQPVLRAVEAVQKAGLRPVRVDLAGLALLRAGGPPAVGPGVAEARVDIGAEVTTVVVSVDGVPRFVRMLAGEGGAKLSRALVERTGVTLQEAEELKRRLGVTTAGPAGAAPSDTSDVDALTTADRAARVVIDRVADGTLSAVRSSMDYFLGNAPDVEGLGRVVLTGGGASLPGLAERFGDALDIQVVLADPLAGLAMSRKAAKAAAALELDSPFAVAAGLGLGEVA